MLFVIGAVALLWPRMVLASAVVLAARPWENGVGPELEPESAAS